MQYNIGDQVEIVSCPNPKYVGLVGTVVIARVDGTYNVKPNTKPDPKVWEELNTVFVYDTEIRPA